MLRDDKEFEFCLYIAANVVQEFYSIICKVNKEYKHRFDIIYDPGVGKPVCGELINEELARRLSWS